MNTIEAIQKRRSVRKFTDQMVPREVIEQMGMRRRIRTQGRGGPWMK